MIIHWFYKYGRSNIPHLNSLSYGTFFTILLHPSIPSFLLAEKITRMNILSRKPMQTWASMLKCYKVLFWTRCMTSVAETVFVNSKPKRAYLVSKEFNNSMSLRCPEKLYCINDFISMMLSPTLSAPRFSCLKKPTSHKKAAGWCRFTPQKYQTLTGALGIQYV